MNIPVTNWPEVARTLFRTFGARGAALRFLHEGRRVASWFRDTPRFKALSSPPPGLFRIDKAAMTAATDVEIALERAQRVVDGEYLAFRSRWRPLPKKDSGWLTHPLTGYTISGRKPWWEVPLHDSTVGDIKDLWEPARFGWLYELIRAYVLTADDRFAISAFKNVKLWAASSPPFQGPHWACGQEAAIRAVALLYTEANLADAPSFETSARALIQDILAATGERIADAVGYAISQRNNHAISEATGLVLLGVRFADTHPEAPRWIDTGHRLLERLILEQFESDGWYIQHSFNYQRLALEQCVLAERSLGSVGRNLSDGAVGRLTAAADLIGTIIEPRTGIVPNYGANDGAYIHPVSLADYRDYRPVLSEVCATWQHPVSEDLDLAMEPLAWLNLPAPPRTVAVKEGLWSGSSGWVAARKNSIQVFLRAGRYTSRPGHIDPLHVDIRYGSREIVVDPGTFAYNAPRPWSNGLAGASVHNGPLIDDREPGQRGPRFLWYVWPEADIVEARETEDGYVIVVERPGQVRRQLTVKEDGVEIRDTMLSRDAKQMRIRWLLHPAADCAWAKFSGTWREAKEGSIEGWFSPNYGERIPSKYVEVLQPSSQGITYVSSFSPPVEP